MHPSEGQRLNISNGDLVEVTLDGTSSQVTALLDDSLPEGVVLIPRSVGVPIQGPAPVELRVVEPAVA
jgi:anaerobic selenocysteine-containing dehydrogenase